MAEIVAVAPPADAPQTSAAAPALKGAQRKEIVPWYLLDDRKDGRENLLAPLTNSVIAALQAAAGELGLTFAFLDDHTGWTLKLPKKRWPQSKQLSVSIVGATADCSEVLLAVTSLPRKAPGDPFRLDCRLDTKTLASKLKEITERYQQSELFFPISEGVEKRA